MSTSRSQDPRSAQDAKRRKRKEHAKSRAPEPKNIVSGAGQPLDLSVRRELEEQLGHDFSRVRLHTDRDADALTGMLGADAVAVGQDIFFREGAFRPGTSDGQRLLAHELLHTVQNPDGLGALRAGRDLGAVSLPQQTMEREAESAAQDLVRDGEPAPQVREGQATPGWLRYATVDADRSRMEQLDPATLVDRLANGLLRSLRGDPEDRSKRVRIQLAQLSPQVQDSVLDRLELRLPAPALDRLLDLVEEAEEGPLPMKAAAGPEAVPDEAGVIEEERARETAEERAETEKPGKGRGEGETAKGAGDADPQGGQPAAGGPAKAPGASSGSAEAASAATDQAASKDREDAAARQQGRSEEKGRDNEESQQGAQEDKDSAADGQAEDAPESAEEPAAEQEPQGAGDERADEDSGQGGAAAPGALDRSAAEPGERDRTGASGVRRSVGDPENEEDADDEPLGLEAELAELHEGEQDDEESEEEGGGDTEDSLPEGSLEGATPAARNGKHSKTWAERQAEGMPGGSSATGQEQSAGAAGQTDAEAGGDASSSAEEEAESRLIQELQPDGSLETGSGPDPDSAGTEDGRSAGTSGRQGPDSTDNDGSGRDKEQADERRDDAEAKRRDEAARTADDGGGAPVPGAGGETTPPGQLAKAEEDGRRQSASTASGSSASGSAGGSSAGSRSSGTAETDRKSTAASGGQSGTDTAVEPPAESGPATGKDTADGGTAPVGGGKAEEETPRPVEPTESTGVTEGKGPATAAGPEAGPEKVSTAGPSPAPKLAPGNGPSPMSTPQAKDNAPGTAEPSKSAAAKSPPRPKSAPKRQAARKAARSAGRGGGGSRTASAPAPARGGRRGGGSSGPAKPKKEAPAPDVSRATPESGLATASTLKPHQMLETFKGVNGAVGRSVAKERTALRKGPPKTERPSGSPKTVPGGPRASAPGTYTHAKVSRTDAAKGRTPEIAGEQKPQGELPGADMEEPSWWDIAVTIGAKLLGKLLKELLPLDDLIDSILSLPTKDEGLRGAKVGDAPGLPLQDDSDPQRTDEQGQKLDERKTELHRSGREDAARPMGEDQLYPDVPRETLTGKVPGGGKGGKGGSGKTFGSGVPIESASAVAEHDRGPQIRAGFADGRQKMTQEHQAKDDRARDDKQKHDKDLQQEVSASGKKQADAREKGQSDISDSRDKWRKEQDDKTSDIDGKTGKKYDKVRKDITDKEEQTDKDVDKRTEDDNKKIEDEQTGAEQEAEKKQDEGKKDADNWLEEAIDQLKKWFEELKNAIKYVFEQARKAVTDLIENFKQQVFKLIDDARNWVIEQINDFADALIALGDELLADYPAMRDKWRNTINGARDWAVDKVNQAADALKEVAGKLLDGLAGALLAGLDLLEGGLLAAVEVAETATVGALEFGAAVVEGLGEWAAIFNDIVSDPGDWISKAGSAAETGSKEYLFDEIKAAVKTWFNQKVQEIVGIPMEDFQELIQGGVSVEEMGRMAWDEALPQLPVIIGVMVVEKVVAKLIPGAGWVMAIIDALKTAWGALSEILAAFGLFMDFLKSVKSGNGALPFAKAVAAGVVALLELVYEFLIEGVGRFMGKVAERLGDMLKNLRKKKNKPDEPDGPPKPGDNKPGAADKPASADKPGAADKPASADKPGERPAPRKPSPDKASRPKPGPRPTKRPSPEKKPRPAHAPKPKKKRDDDERREDGREVNAARRRAQDAKRKLRDDDGKSGTEKRRGPARDTLRPKKRRPTSDRPPGRGPASRHPDSRRPDDTRRPDRERDRDERRRETDDSKKSRRSEPRTRSKVRRARQTVKSAINRARRAGRKLYGKGRKLAGKLNSRVRRLRDQWRRRYDKLRDRDRRRDRNRRREAERKQPATREQAMPKARFRNENGSVHTLMYRGRGRTADLVVRSQTDPIREYFASWARDIDAIEDDPQRRLRQQEAMRGAEAAHTLVEKIQKQLPPRRTRGESAATEGAYTALRLQLTRLAARLELREFDPDEPPLLPMVLPEYRDGKRGTGFMATGINKSISPGEKSTAAKPGNPFDWDKVPQPLRDSTAWVRMHLMTEKLGGMATGSNLVPAPGTPVNSRFADRLELPAHKAVVKRKTERMIWYQVGVGYYAAPDHNFPKSISMKWGGYRVVGNTWQREPAQYSYARDDIELPHKRDSRFDINGRGPDTISKQFGVTRAFAKAVRDNSPYRNINSLVLRMRLHKAAIPPGRLRNFDAELQAIIDADTHKQIRYT